MNAINCSGKTIGSGVMECLYFKIKAETGSSVRTIANFTKQISSHSLIPDMLYPKLPALMKICFLSVFNTNMKFPMMEVVLGDIGKNVYYNINYFRSQ